MTPVFDSDVIIDFLQGNPAAKEEMEKYRSRAISTVTWIEVMTGAPDEEAEGFFTEFLSGNFVEIELSREIAAIAAHLRRKRRKLKLPDAIIWATAMQQNTLLVTRNSKDFPKGDPAIRIPYVLKAH